jgi:hypothetical protein
MKVERFADLETALCAVMQKERDYVLVGHHLLKGEIIRPHTDKTDEWVLMQDGKIAMTFGKKQDGNQLKLKLKYAGPEVIVIHVPSGETHSLEAKSELNYYVLKVKK